MTSVVQHFFFQTNDFEGLNNLEKIENLFASQLKDENLFSTLIKLKKISLKLDSKFSSITLKKVLANVLKFEELKINNHVCYRKDRYSFLDFKSLKSLLISDVVFFEGEVNFEPVETYGMFSNLPSLSNLSIVLNGAYSTIGYIKPSLFNISSDVFIGLENLTSLTLFIYPENLLPHSFSGLPNLKNLYLGFDRSPSVGLGDKEDAPFPLLADLPQLEKLTLWRRDKEVIFSFNDFVDLKGIKCINFEDYTEIFSVKKIVEFENLFGNKLTSKSGISCQ